MDTKHEHGPECVMNSCGHQKPMTPSEYAAAQPKHVCGPYCYHNSIGHKMKQVKAQRRATHEKVWNSQLGRVRQPFSKEVTVPLHLVGVLPLVVPPGAPAPSPEQIQAAQKEHRRRRNARRRRR